MPKSTKVCSKGVSQNRHREDGLLCLTVVMAFLLWDGLKNVVVWDVNDSVGRMADYLSTVLIQSNEVHIVNPK